MRFDWAMSDPDRRDENLTDAERLEIFRQTCDAIARRIGDLAALRDPSPDD